MRSSDIPEQVSLLIDPRKVKTGCCANDDAAGHTTTQRSDSASGGAATRGWEGVCGWRSWSHTYDTCRYAAYAALLYAFCLVTDFALDTEDLAGLEAGTDSGANRLLNRAYFAASTVSTVGYGDVHPRSQLARGLVLVQQLIILLGGVAVLRSLVRVSAQRAGVGV